MDKDGDSSGSLDATLDKDLDSGTDKWTGTGSLTLTSRGWTWFTNDTGIVALYM